MRLAYVAVLALATGCARKPANAPEPRHRLHWRPSWRKFQTGDYVWTAGVLGAYAYLQFGMPTAAEPHWRGPILFDEAARHALNADSRDERMRWAKMTDWGWGINVTSAWVTPILIPLTDRFNWRVSWQLAMMNAESMGFAGFVSRIGHVFVGRERPNTEICHSNSAASVVCFGGENASFPSGHAAGAFTGAGLSCVHHLELGLFGHPAADVSWCVAMLGLATFTGIGRNVGDFHYLSDTIVGATIGIASGVGIPLIFHYGVSGGPLLERTYAIMPSSEGFGLSIMGML